MALLQYDFETNPKLTVPMVGWLAGKFTVSRRKNYSNEIIYERIIGIESCRM